MRRKQIKALLCIFAIFAIGLGLVSALGSPEWAKGAVIIAYPVTWLIVGSVMLVRNRRSNLR
jgi:hypothetical protein